MSVVIKCDREAVFFTAAADDGLFLMSVPLKKLAPGRRILIHDVDSQLVEKQTFLPPVTRCSVLCWQIVADEFFTLAITELLYR